MGYYNPCTLITIIDFIVYFLVLLAYIRWGKAKNLYLDLTILAILIITYSYFRKELHRSLGVYTDVNMFGRPMPKYCE
jgi:hypothetical protein